MIENIYWSLAGIKGIMRGRVASFASSSGVVTGRTQVADVATSTRPSTTSTTAGNRTNKICSRNTDLNTTGIIASTDRCNAKVWQKISDLHNQVILSDEEFRN